MNKFKSRYLLIVTITKALVSIGLICGSFNALSYTSSATNTSSSEIPFEVAITKKPHQDCWLTAERNGCGQGESNLRHFFSPHYLAKFSLEKYADSSYSFFTLANVQCYTSPYFRNLFLYIRVINAP